MRRVQALIIPLLLLLFVPRILYSESEPVVSYLQDSQIKWENNRLSGKLKDVPVKAFLEELSNKEGFRLEIIGDLDLKVNAFLDHLTIDQSIKKIMRLTELDYIMIMDRQGPIDGEIPHRIKKLIICHKDKKGLSSTTQSEHPAQLEGEEVAKKKPPYGDDKRGTSVLPLQQRRKEQTEKSNGISRKTEVQFEGSHEDLRDYVEDLSMDGRISPEEYEMIMEKMER